MGLVENITNNLLGTNKKLIQLSQVRRTLLTFIQGKADPTGAQKDYFFDCKTGQKSQTLPKGMQELSATPVVVFACGGGSFVEYETIVKTLNEEICSNNHTIFDVENRPEQP